MEGLQEINDAHGKWTAEKTSGRYCYPSGN